MRMWVSKALLLIFKVASNLMDCGLWRAQKWVQGPMSLFNLKLTDYFPALPRLNQSR
jgi:hypothetical protein